ncbi:MAG: prepilin-type N-terminal cleavage/methylation domain-containing protein [Deltaproteobacteria bacterium]|nr:prepilin-type N-terminal cleavage/methylation domain-containing protein [Deltaproteobacteria bacterium]
MNRLEQSRRTRHPRGFTMIELTLVIAILPLMVASLIGVSNFTASNLDRAARRLESDLRYCQQLAMAEEVNCGFRVNTVTQYQVYRQNLGNLVVDPYTRQGMQIDLPTNYQGVLFNANNYQVEFNRFGQPVIGSGTPIIIGMTGQTKSVTVNSTGYVQIQ